MNTKVISGFPAVGKSTLFYDTSLTVLDSDSSLFSWESPGVRHPDFPNNYMQHIKENLGKADYILVSSHDVVRRALEESGIAYTLVYPAVELKDEYIARYKARGNDDKFIGFISSKWDEFIADIEKETFPALIRLNAGEFLKDALLQAKEDEVQFGRDVIVYCAQHRNPHFTGWCTVDVSDKTRLKAITMEAAYPECREKGFGLFGDDEKRRKGEL